MIKTDGICCGQLLQRQLSLILGSVIILINWGIANINKMINPISGKTVNIKNDKSAILEQNKICSYDDNVKLVLAVFFALLLAGALLQAPTIDEKSVYIEVVVDEGDTVWGIAARYATNKEDIRDLVHRIKNVNGLEQDVQIYAGQTLKIPVSTEFIYTKDNIHMPEK